MIGSRSHHGKSGNLEDRLALAGSSRRVPMLRIDAGGDQEATWSIRSLTLSVNA